jgi:hypothetical protein
MLPLHQSPNRGESLGTVDTNPSEGNANIRSHMTPRTYKEFALARALREQGLGDRAISRELGIPYSTLRYWRARPEWKPQRQIPTFWRPSDPEAYCYLLGLYLGDGCLGVSPRSAQLHINLDAKYPLIVREAKGAIERTIPGVRAGHCDGNGRGVCVYASSPNWIIAFPQHGPGRKHKRRIELVEWQRELTHRHPQGLIRGLIHSDGSRCINSFKVALPTDRIESYAYVRYFFTNYSADIRRIFCEHCDLVGIRWTQSSFKNISIAHRDSVALLDSFVGPKM